MHVGMLINDAVKCSRHFVHKLIQHGSMLFDGLNGCGVTAEEVVEDHLNAPFVFLMYSFILARLRFSFFNGGSLGFGRHLT